MSCDDDDDDDDDDGDKSNDDDVWFWFWFWWGAVSSDGHKVWAELPIADLSKRLGETLPSSSM